MYYGNTNIQQGAGALGANGKLMAYHDGILGGSPETHAQSIGIGQFDGPLRAAWDGVLGTRPPAVDMPGKLRAYRDGSLGEYFAPTGMGEYFSPMSGLGQANGAAVVDLADPDVLREVKTAMALLVPQLTVTEQGQKTYTEQWYDSGIWDEAAGALWFQVAQMLAGENGGAEALSKGSNSRRYPNGSGVVALVDLYRASPDYGPEYVAQTFPRLDAATAADAAPKVEPPFFTLEAKVKDQPGEPPMIAGMSSAAVYGLGAVALLGVVLVMASGKKTRARAL